MVLLSTKCSASNIFHKSRSPNLVLLRQAAVHSTSKIKHFYSFEVKIKLNNIKNLWTCLINVLQEDFHGSLHIVPTPRISIDDTESNSSLPNAVPHRPYLKYHRRSNGHALSGESDPRQIIFNCLILINSTG